MNIKTTIICFLYIVICISCNGQGDTLNKNLNKNDMYPVSADFEQLNLNTFKTKAAKSTGLKVTNGQSVDIDVYNFTEKLDNGNVVIISGDNAGGFVYEERINDQYFNLVKTYYPDGQIKEKGLQFNVTNGTFRKGTWYVFKKGEKDATLVDYDGAFKFSFENLLQLLAHENIPLKKGPIPINPGLITEIARGISAGKAPFYKVRYLKSTSKVEEVVINGITGKIIGRQLINYTNN